MKITGLLILLFVCGLLEAQEMQTSFYDSLKQKTIYLDSIPLSDLRDLAANHHYWDNYEKSELIYDYLIAKNVFTANPNDTSNFAYWGEYMNLVHLRLVRHRYSEASEFLELAKKTEKPEHFCGNAYAAMYAEEEAFDLECRLGLATNEEDRQALWNELMNSAFAEDGFGSPAYAGGCAINYLRKKFSDAEIRYLFKKACATIAAERQHGEWNYSVSGTFEILHAKVHFTFWQEEYISDDPENIKQYATNMIRGTVDGWIDGYY